VPMIASVGTAVPPYKISQQEGREFVRQLFGDCFPNIDRLLSVFDSAQIDSRHFCVPIEWFSSVRHWKEKNDLYIENAVQLSAKAIKKALERAGLHLEEIDHLVFVSSTGLATPSIDARLFHHLKLKPNVKRTPIWGLGCAGGAAGISRGFDLAKAHPDQLVIVCCVELCGLTFLKNDLSKSNLIGTSLFGDGAAAVIVAGDEAAQKHGFFGPNVIATRSTIWEDSIDVMGWDVVDEGLKVVFSKDIPTMVETKIRPEVMKFLRDHELSEQNITRYIAHPGGMKVLKAYEQALTLPSQALRHSRTVLRTYGNMSSSTVLYVLEKELEDAHQADEYGLLLALGPGFSSEQVLLRW